MLYIVALFAPLASAEPPAEMELPKAFERSPLTWARVDMTSQEALDWVESEERDHLGIYSKTVRVTSEGVWVVSGYAPEAHAERTDDYNALALKNGETDVYGGDDLRDAEDWEEDDSYSESLLSWTGGSCSGTDWALWDDESRNVRVPGTTLNPRDRRTVQIGPSGCSGVVVAPDRVLTAAHCVLNDDWPGGDIMTAPPPLIVSVGAGLYANSQSSTIDAINLDGNWNGVRDDYALIELSSNLTTGWMLLSNASNATLEGLVDPFNTGHPGYVDGTSCTNGQFRLYSQFGDIDDVSTHVSGRGIVKSFFDATQGNSGGPMYSCPANDPDTCTGGEAGTVFGLATSITSRWGSVWAVRGPRVPGRLRTWTLGLL